jgi:hypothetical protein
VYSWKENKIARNSNKQKKMASKRVDNQWNAWGHKREKK